MRLQTCRRHPAAGPFMATCSGCTQELYDIQARNERAAAEAPAVQVRAGDLVEATVASNRPRTIRIRVDREPWVINHRSTTLTDGREVIAVFTDSIRVVEAAPQATAVPAPTRQQAEGATVVAAATVLVLAPVDLDAVRNTAHLIAPEPEPVPVDIRPAQPALDLVLAARVRAALGLPATCSAPRPEWGETETRVSFWSVRELNAAYVRVRGTVTARQVERTLSDDTTYTVTEVTVTVELPGVGDVQAFTDWDPADESHAFSLAVVIDLNRVPAAV